MKAAFSFEPQLVIKETALPPGGEWRPQFAGWSCLHITSGVAYWLNPRSNRELATGSVFIYSQAAPGLIRASQVGGVLICHFRLNPERLTGLLTLTEQQTLQNAAVQEKNCARLFLSSEPLAEKFKGACARTTQGESSRSLPTRLELLDLFFRAFSEELSSCKPEQGPQVDAQARLKLMLNQTAASELMDLSFQDLVEAMRCTPRHLSRIFHKVVGVSFREKQAQVRLVRAQELLATTESKVLDVALESGYQSLSLFNLMFKKRFGMTPGEWRSRQRTKTDASPRKPQSFSQHLPALRS